MLFLELFLTFLKIGIFTFGGGYAMVALIQNEVVLRHSWISAQEFTDILAISQMTPGPIGINTATYTGYKVALSAGYEGWVAVLGSCVASFAVVLLPVLLMLLVLKLLGAYRNNRYVDVVFRVMRLLVVGLIASSALSLMTVETFGQPSLSRHFILSVFIFVAVLFVTLFPFAKYGKRPPSPIWLIIASGIFGWLLF